MQMTSRIARLNRVAALLPHDVAALALRIFPAAVFWQSGRTKVEGFWIKDSTWFLFQHEYALPVLLVLGLFTRAAALGLLTMTVVIQVFVYPGAWITHGLWAAAFLALIAQGPGRLSLDHLLGLDRGRG
jgi:putative oxidoreductase